MPGLAALTANPALEQIFVWGILSQVLGAALQPFLATLTSQAFELDPSVPLSPQELADAVLRNVWTQDAAAGEARKSGIHAERFATLVKLAGNAPDPGSLAIALRRKLIDPDRYLTGIRQGRLRDEWADLVRELAVVQPPPTAMLEAYLEGQLPESDARARYAQLGGDPDYFDILYHTQGQAPTPVQALELANRGIIPWAGQGPDAVSFEQAFLEGPWRNKWQGPFRALGAYLPPPRTVTAMHREGSLSDAQALDLLEKQGLTPELAKAYLASGSRTKLAKSRDLSQATVEKLYTDRLIDRAKAAEFLGVLGYAPDEAEFVLETVDLAVAEKALGSAVSRIHTLYVGHKLEATGARTALANLGVAGDQADQLLTIWGHEHAANVHQLTEAQVVAAFGLDLMDQATAQARLESMGYAPWDAWALLSIHHKSALPDQPAMSALPAGAGP